MSAIKSLADQLRTNINGQATAPQEQPAKVRREKKKPPDIPEILDALRAYDNRNHKSLVHTRFDLQTLKTMNQFKMATGVDVTKLVAFAVQQLFERHPELKTIIKQYIQQLEL
jgi:hypothetical protein